MKKNYYSAPVAELEEAVNACCFLAESQNGTAPGLEDGGWDITW